MSTRDWLLDKLTFRALVVTALTALMIACLPFGLSQAMWLRSNSVLWRAALWGAGLGLLLARVARRSVVAGFLMVVGGALFIIQFQSRALPPFGPAMRELVLVERWAGFGIAKVVSGVVNPAVEYAPLPPPSLPEWRAAGERLWLYGWNLQADWPLTLAPRQWERGQILLGSIMGLLAWTAVAWAVWALIRLRSAWGALGPVLGLLAISIYYTWKGWGLLLTGAAAGLLLAGNASLRRVEDRWRMGSYYGLAVEWWGWNGIITVAVGVAMALAIWMTDPQFSQWINENLSPQKTATVGSQDEGGRPGTSSGGEESLPGVWPRQHLLGGRPDLTERPVMSVRTPSVPPAHLYWRASSYDQYTGQGWIRNTAADMAPDAEPLWPDSPDPPPNFALLRQSYRLENPSRRIHAVGRPVRLSQPAEGLWFDELGADLVAVRSVTAQSAYEVLSWVPTATPDELREATEDYPAWMEEGYLTLPEDLPDRVVVLAQEITADAPTAYDKALALQSHLRTYEYSLDLPAPPDDRDVVDHFLFDLKRGYCDYYASAMVVMARSVGLPARLAVGYGTGVYDPEFEVYRVTMADGHSWVEIYFPSFGWIPFEPTAAFPEATHGLADEWAEPPLSDELLALEEADAPAGIDWGKAWPLAAAPAVIVAIVGGVALVSALRAWKRRQGRPQQIVASLYAELLRQGRRLGVPLSDSQTPHEFLSTLLGELAVRAQNAPRWGGDWDARLEQATQVAVELVALYAEGCYSPRQPTQRLAKGALDAWPMLHRALWMFWLVGNKP